MPQATPPPITPQGWALVASPGLVLVLLELLVFSSWPIEVKDWTDRYEAALPNLVLHVTLGMALFGIAAASRWSHLAPRHFVMLSIATGIAPAVLLPGAVLGGTGTLSVYAGCAGAQVSATVAGQALVWLSIRTAHRWRLAIKHKAV